MDLGIAGKRAAVAASTSGLGFAAAQALAAEGVQVAICGRQRERVEKAAAAIGGEVVPIEADVSTPEGATGFVDEAQRALGQVDILVVNVPGTPAGTFGSTALEAYGPALQNHVLSAVGMCKAAVPGMQSRGWGRVVAITSVGVRQPFPDLILSNTGRSGLTAFLKTLALEVAPDGVTVNTVQPGYHRTERLESWAGERLADLAADVPANAVGEPADFGAVVAFLCSRSAGYLTGAAVPVDGGLYGGLQ
ncbi:SDR family oxidoreductase [Geodermatophilus ruber]|uniref:3-oxoacyl-[acyl-carrier protein] reductase n=1 Tax=Geodermatophilus ruber TaxID=504800 RepID=A0A1I4HC06_9ACTN|nr:SDR family oxidoreductase [Geodermatophilus ruber]SFL39695.1 3-oxoacyl-[acyl-carrier protein] reductase [Geodermatophilus ruber]